MFLRFCKSRHAPVTIVLAKEYLGEREKQVTSCARDALRWFVKMGAQSRSLGGEEKRGVKVERVEGGAQKVLAQNSGVVAMGRPIEGRERFVATNTVSRGNGMVSRGIGDGLLPGGHEGGGRRSGTPGLAGRDRGDTVWERGLIAACRERGFLWRTEETYRMWGRRFAEFIAPRVPELVGAEEVGAFLSELAVGQRASTSTQKQALNALVFLMESGLKCTLGEIDFHRSRPRERMPVVLSRDECLGLFRQLSGTTKLMAELMYGAGLRLMELLRLRVHHLDMERGQLKVYGGKGDKDRITVLPGRLVQPLREHVDRLRMLFTEDRTAGLPGVWLPEGLARKFRNAGVSWEWQWLFPSRETSVDPDTGVLRRHHLSDTPFQNAIRRAAQQAGIAKRVTPHVLRHSFVAVLPKGTRVATLRFAAGQALTQAAA